MISITVDMYSVGYGYEWNRNNIHIIIISWFKHIPLSYRWYLYSKNGCLAFHEINVGQFQQHILDWIRSTYVPTFTLNYFDEQKWHSLRPIKSEEKKKNHGRTASNIKHAWPTIYMMKTLLSIHNWSEADVHVWTLDIKIN